MARKSRIHLPGGLYHVMLRGNGGQEIFFDDADRVYFETLVAEGIRRFDHRIHAYCWMGNHVHLAIQAGFVPLSKVMQNLAFRYTRWVNRAQGRIGHLFEGRYKAILVDADSYLLELVRYIHLNPVRAGLVKEPADYHWSGHRTYLGHEAVDWLTLAKWGGIPIPYVESQTLWSVPWPCRSKLIPSLKPKLPRKPNGSACPKPIS